MANAFFVVAEFALVAVDRDRVEHLAEEGSRAARRVATELRRLSFNLSGAQLGITVSSLVLGFIAEPTIARALLPLLGSLPEGTRSGIAIGVALALATIVQMVCGELVPKGVAIAKPLPAAMAVARPVRFYGLVFGPLIRVLNGAADWTVRRLGIEPREELRSVRSFDELELLIASSGEEGTLDAASYRLLTRTIRFANKTAADALIPRVDVVAVPARASVDDLCRAAVDTGHSRFLVVGDDLDDVVGVAHAKDVLRVPGPDRATTPVTAVCTAAHFIPEGRDLESLLSEMQAEGIQLAVVLDEYGGLAGIVTLEDLLEEIVGDIEDEHDLVPPVDLTSSPAPGTWVLDGSLHLDEVQELTGVEVPQGQYETLAGFVLDRLGRLPDPGDRVAHDDWVVEVLAMERRRISALRLVASTPAPVAEPDHAGSERRRGEG